MIRVCASASALLVSRWVRPPGEATGRSSASPRCSHSCCLPPWLVCSRSTHQLCLRTGAQPTDTLLCVSTSRLARDVARPHTAALGKGDKKANTTVLLPESVVSRESEIHKQWPPGAMTEQGTRGPPGSPTAFSMSLSKPEVFLLLRLRTLTDSIRDSTKPFALHSLSNDALSC